MALVTESCSHLFWHLCCHSWRWNPEIYLCHLFWNLHLYCYDSSL